MAATEFRTLSELFLKAVEQRDKPNAFLSKFQGHYQGLSSRAALQKVAVLASSLARLGVGRGDCVALISENRLEWALTDYALMGLGAINVPIYPTLLDADVEYILRDSGSKGVVVSTESQLTKVVKVRARLPELGFILVMDPASLDGTSARGWMEVIDAEPQPGTDFISLFRSKALEVKPEEIASIIYTSGTTARPKGVILTHSNLVSNIQASSALFGLAKSDVAISFLPLSHVFERMLDYYYFWQGVAIAYAESFDALPQNLLEVRPTVMAIVPRVLEKIYDKIMETVRHAPAGRRKLFFWALRVGRQAIPYQLEGRALPLRLVLSHALANRLVFSKVRAQLGGRLQFVISGAAPLTRDLAEYFFAMGLPVYEGYGLTETSPVIAVNYPGHVKLGTVGRPLPGVDVKFGDAEEDQERGASREILVRGPNVTPGYYHLEEENREAFKDGWFRTGDLGRLDPEGYLAITGRRKHLFKTSGGKYVSPEKLENLFQGHPYVSQIMVVGDARKFVGALVVPNFARLEAYAQERGIAFKDHQELIANPEVQSFMQEQIDVATLLLPPHEKIRQIILVPREFTMSAGELSATLKIKRRVVEERYSAQIEEMFHRHAPEGHPRPAPSRPG
jgi:long-chain acyl-CoA synthetase